MLKMRFGMTRWWKHINEWYIIGEAYVDLVMQCKDRIDDRVKTQRDGNECWRGKGQAEGRFILQLALVILKIEIRADAQRWREQEMRNCDKTIGMKESWYMNEGVGLWCCWSQMQHSFERLLVKDQASLFFFLPSKKQLRLFETLLSLQYSALLPE